MSLILVVLLLVVLLLMPVLVVAVVTMVMVLVLVSVLGMGDEGCPGNPCVRSRFRSFRVRWALRTYRTMKS